MSSRIDFGRPTLDTLSKRVGGKCSNPQCRQSTAGPGETATASVNIGVGAHIRAASPGGPRFDQFQAAEERSAIENGIWLCQNCAKLIDNDPVRYSVDTLAGWKAQAEQSALQALKGEEEQIGLVAEIKAIRRNAKITGNRHDYRLEVTIHNTGTMVLRGYHVDLLFPTAVLTSSTGIVVGRSDKTGSLFRKAWATQEDDIFPGEAPLVFDIPYHMTSALFELGARLMDLPVRAMLFVGGKRLSTLDERFGDYQIY